MISFMMKGHPCCTLRHDQDKQEAGGETKYGFQSVPARRGEEDSKAKSTQRLTRSQKIEVKKTGANLLGEPRCS